MFKGQPQITIIIQPGRFILRIKSYTFMKIKFMVRNGNNSEGLKTIGLFGKLLHGQFSSIVMLIITGPNAI